MRQTWRWFGPTDAISIAEIRQTGAQGVVSALHHVPPGQMWSIPDIKLRQKHIEEPAGMRSGLTWDVVESVPVSEAREHLNIYTNNQLDAFVEGAATHSKRSR